MATAIVTVCQLCARNFTRVRINPHSALRRNYFAHFVDIKPKVSGKGNRPGPPRVQRQAPHHRP